MHHTWGGAWERLIRSVKTALTVILKNQASREEVLLTALLEIEHCTRKHWELSQHYADIIWRRWLKEYIPTLIPRRKWQEKDVPLKKGDIVLILDDNISRNLWRKGVIVRVMLGSDGRGRVAKVQSTNDMLIRPARK